MENPHENPLAANPLDRLTDERKLELVHGLVASMSEKFREAVLNELMPIADGDTLEITFTSTEGFVQVRFARSCSGLVLPRASAIQFAELLLQHADRKFSPP